MIQRIKKMSRLEVLLLMLILLSTSMLFNFYLYSEVEPLKEEAKLFKTKIDTLNHQIYELEVQKIYIDLMQNNWSNYEGFLQGESVGGGQ